MLHVGVVTSIDSHQVHGSAYSITQQMQLREVLVVPAPASIDVQSGP